MMDISIEMSKDISQECILNYPASFPNGSTTKTNKSMTTTKKSKTSGRPTAVNTNEPSNDRNFVIFE